MPDTVYPLRALDQAGFLECLPKAEPIAKVRTFTYSHVLHASCVGSMVAAFVLGLADRHQDNMLLVGEQVFAHIDFGYVAGSRPWPFDTGPFPIPQRFRDACGAARWKAFLDDVHDAYLLVKGRKEELCAVAQSLASPLVGPPGMAPTGPPHVGAGQQRTSFAAFLQKTLDRPASEVRQLAADGPDNFETRVKEATYVAGMYAGQKLREAGVPV